jgi:DNA modification methylase
MVTDPPYGVSYDANWRNQAGTTVNGVLQHVKTGKVRRRIGARAIGKVENDDRADWREAWALFSGDVAYVWHGSIKAIASAESLEACGFQLRSQIIWAKSQFVIGRGHYHPQHEPLWYAVRKGKTAHWVGGHKQSTVWQIDKPHASETGHSTQKPIDCMRIPIENNSNVGDAVYEPFSGSFTTGIACEMTKRRCLAIEISPPYVDVGVVRWQDFTGRSATLEATGQTYAEVRALRVSDETNP